MVVITNEVQIRNAPTKVLLQTAEDIVGGLTSQSKVFNKVKFDKLPAFSHAELHTGRIVGRGGFCTVKELTAIRSGTSRKMFMARRRSNSNLNFDAEPSDGGVMNMTYNGVEMSDKEYLTHSCNRGKGAGYVVKQVAEEWVYTNRITFLKGTVDLAVEAQFLATLSHPNIIQLKGVAEGGPFREGYFLILDRLHETLPMKLKKWMTTDRQCTGITGVFVGGKKKQTSLFVGRMEAAFGVANALNYLHSRNLVYRDLVSNCIFDVIEATFYSTDASPFLPQKPDNIGFDSQGNVKLFDFGLMKELSDKDKTANGLYKLTGFTGSIRYMAPEVGLRKPYNHKVDNCKYDVCTRIMMFPRYDNLTIQHILCLDSFSMLLWYIMALEPPYGFYTPEMFTSRVFQQGHRPVTMGDWPEGLCQLMKSCWDVRINARPNFDTIMDVIQREVEVVDVAASEKMMPHLRG
jgi:serine/threonine protein kinase